MKAVELLIAAGLALGAGPGGAAVESGPELELGEQARGLSPNVLQLATQAASCAKSQGLADTSVLSIIDYSLPSTERRLWVLEPQRLAQGLRQVQLPQQEPLRRHLRPGSRRTSRLR